MGNCLALAADQMRQCRSQRPPDRCRSRVRPSPDRRTRHARNIRAVPSGFRWPGRSCVARTGRRAGSVRSSRRPCGRRLHRSCVARADERGLSCGCRVVRREQRWSSNRRVPFGSWPPGGIGSTRYWMQRAARQAVPHRCGGRQCRRIRSTRTTAFGSFEATRGAGWRKPPTG